MPETKTVPKAKIKLPATGLYLGSGVYPHGGKLICSGKAFTYWSPDYPLPRHTIDLIVEANQGNTLQFWQHGQELLELAKSAAARGIYVMFLYSSAAPEISARFRKELGDFYLGYDFGERFSFRLKKCFDDGSEPTLKNLADGLMEQVSAHVEERKRNGWGPIMATGGNFHMDYEVAAGTDIPLIEEFAFRHLLMASSMSRGLYRQHNLPLWGSYLAHEWYSWIPHANPLRMPLFRMSLYLKYMSGAKLIINESGNWALQSTHCTDSPMHTMPRVIGEPPGLRHTGSDFHKRHIEDARKLFCNIDYRSPTAGKYRREISDFYEFIKANPAPAGQPEAVIALAKGNYDICFHEYSPAFAIAGATNLAERNPDWFEGDPERGWDIIKSVFYPRPPVLAPHKNNHVSGTPYGMTDIVSFANDQMDADFLKRNYQTLIFSGWNTCSDKQYAVLVDFVRSGGKLCLGIPHLSRNCVRNYRNYKREELINGGDFTELCGLKVTGCGDRFYWATGNDLTPNAIGLAVPRRYGMMGSPLGELEIADPAKVEVLAADDERFRPVILRCKSGKGEVFFINNWYYPGVLNTDDHAGATLNSKGLMGLLYGYLGSISRGHVWITGSDMRLPDEDCEHIAFSYFPDAGKICLQNIDFRNSRRCVLHQFGDVDPIELAPAEFRLLDSVVLSPEEKFNQE